MATIRKTRPDSASGDTQPSEVAMTVIGFADVLAPGPSDCSRGTGFKMKLSRPSKRIRIVGDLIKVVARSAAIRFTLVSSKGDKDRYYPIGITFFRNETCELSEAERLGLLNFPRRGTRLADQSLSITARFPAAKTGKIVFKFSLVVQRASDGKIGIIDPAIAHDSSDLRGP